MNRKLILKCTAIMLAIPSVLSAQDLRSDMNSVLQQVALPVFLAVMVIALLVGIAKNWRLINDENSEGNKKQGWMNIAYMVGYIMVAVTVVAFAVSKIAGISISI